MKSIFAGVILLLLINTYGSACNCKSPLLEKEIALTQNIFLATVLSKEQIIVRTERGSAHQLFRTTLAVSETFKGVTADTVKVLSRTSDCAFEFDIDSAYIVFASKHPRYMQLFTSPCQRTALTSQSKKLIRQLNKVKNQIDQLHKLDSEELYVKLWKNEIFDRVDDPPKLSMSFDEAKDYVTAHLKPCEIVFEPKNKHDSLIIESPSFEAASRRFTVVFEVDTSGHIINPCIESNWHAGMPLKDDAMQCKQNAIELVQHMPALYPAEIRNIKVRSVDKFVVDYSLVMDN